MRAFGLIGLVLALVIVGVLVKKQLGAVSAVAPVPVTAPPASEGAPATVRAQSQQLQQDIKKQLDGTLSRPRAMPEDN